MQLSQKSAARILYAHARAMEAKAATFSGARYASAAAQEAAFKALKAAEKRFERIISELVEDEA